MKNEEQLAIFFHKKELLKQHTMAISQLLEDDEFSDWYHEYVSKVDLKTRKERLRSLIGVGFIVWCRDIRVTPNVALCSRLLCACKNIKEDVISGTSVCRLFQLSYPMAELFGFSPACLPGELELYTDLDLLQNPADL
jgi:hypothetical protein